MTASATTVSVFTADQWAQRLLRLYPNRWTSDQAKNIGGILYSLLNSQGTQYNFLQSQLNWVLDACRLATATDTALDTFANDYFGVGEFPRGAGESDDVYRARIQANMLQSGGTRADIIRVVETLTGQTPRVIEPWNVLDVGACNAVSFVGYDTAANPARVGSLSFPYQGFVESILPPYIGAGANPIWGIGSSGAAVGYSYLVGPGPTWFLGESGLDAAINRVRMFGTTIWRRYGSAY